LSSPTPGGDLQAALEALRPHSSGQTQSDSVYRHLTVPVKRGAQQLEAIVRDLDTAHVPLNDLALRRPTLDDVFLSLTGSATAEASHPEAAAVPQSLERSSR
jgi:ABC-2 type transport system ATP-binding protein